MAIPGKVLQGGNLAKGQNVQFAQENGATDREIHGTVLIAAAFCMYNRHVDGLSTWQPHDDSLLEARGKRLTYEGYRTPSTRGPLKDDLVAAKR
jgi:hypothetical protein